VTEVGQCGCRAVPTLKRSPRLDSGRDGRTKVRKPWRLVAVIAFGLCVAVLLPVVINLATGAAVPAFFRQAWVSWTGVAVFGLVAVVAFVLAWPPDPPPPRPPWETAGDHSDSNGPPGDDDEAGADGDGSLEPGIPDEPLEAVPVRVGRLPETVHGRGDLIDQLKEYRKAGGLVVLVGAGGMGKTTLARELVRSETTPEPPPAWEVTATSRRLLGDLHAVAANLGGSATELAAVRDGDRAGPDCLWRLLGRAPDRWLLIVDNADELELLGKPGRPGGQPPDPVADGTGWVRAGLNGLVLVTSRQRDQERWPGSAKFIEVGVLDVKDAAALLRELAPYGGSERKARALARRLGCLPLALRLAGKYLGSRLGDHTTFDAFRRDLESDPRVIRLIDQFADDPQAVEPEAIARMLVMRTWELSLDALARHGLPQARPLLRLLSCFAPAVPIPLTLLQGGRLDAFLAACSEPVRREPPRLLHVLQGLEHFGLITTARGRGPEVHPVVADTNRACLMEGQADDPPEEAVRATAVALLAAPIVELTIDRQSAWATVSLLTPHLQALIANSAVRLSRAALDTLTGITGQAAIGYQHMSQPVFGVELLTSVLAARSGQAGAGPVFLLARQRLAALREAAGEHRAAESIWREVFTAQLREWPRDHPIVLAARHNVTVSVSLRRAWEQVRAYFDELLADEVVALGADHPITLETRHEYALQIGLHDDWNAAEESLRGIINDATLIIGKDAPFTLAARHNLAQVLRRLDRDDEADADSQPLIDDERRTLGEDHIVTAATARLGEGGFIETRPYSVPELHAGLARYWLKKGCASAMADDEPGREAALHVFDDLIATFGDDTDPEIRKVVAEGMHNKAIVLEKLDRALEAVAAYDDLIARYDGDESVHVRESVAIAFHNKAVFSIQLGEPDQASEAAQQALNRYQRLADDKPEDFAEQVAKARTFLVHVKATGPQSMLEYAIALARKDHRAEALAVLDRIVERYGTDTSNEARLLVAKAKLRKGILLAAPPPSD